MGVKTENIGHEDDEIVDDLSDVQVESTSDDGESVDVDKLAALKARMAAKSGKKEVKKEEKEEEEEMPIQILEKKTRSLEFGVIGSGQAGSRLAASMHQLGYDAVVFNTAIQDLEHINIPDANKCLLEYGLGGASKDPQIGHEAAETHRDYISAKIHEQLGDADVFCFCTSLGGGSGGGSIDIMIDIMSSMGKPIVVMTVLPMTNEDTQTKDNSLQALQKLVGYLKQGTIHNLIVVDNAKIEMIFSDVSPMNFYKVSNEAIVNSLNVFNTYSSMASEGMKVIDPMEWTKILIDGGGLSLYGEISVPDYEEEYALAEAVVENLTSGLLAEGFDLEQTKYFGVMFLANDKVWSKIPASSINYAMTMVQEVAGTAKEFRGMYVDNSIEDDEVKVYSFFSGLALPDSRVDELKEEVATQLATLKTKEVSRNLSLNLDIGNKTTSKADEINKKIKSKKSSFNKFKQGLIDKRRK